MSEAVENMKVLTGDTSTGTNHDNIEQQETTDTESTDGSRKSVANKAWFNQFSFKGSQFEAIAEDAQNVYELPAELAKYANKCISIFVLINICSTVF